MDYVTVTSSFLPQNRKRKKLCVQNKKYNNQRYTNVSKMKCILPSPLSIAFNRILFSSYSISQHFSPTSPFLFLQPKESCGRVMYFILLTLYCLLPFATSLQCYTDVEAKNLVTCSDEFKTCFTKYNDSKYIPSAFPFGVLHKYQEAAIVARGCSTKDKVFYRECETHSYGASLEKMCFCSFDNCNPAASMLLKYAAKSSNWYNVSCLGIIIISGILLSNYQCSLLSPLFTVTNKHKRVYRPTLVGQNHRPNFKIGRCKLPQETTGSAADQSFQERWNIRKTIELLLQHCLRKLFNPHYQKCVMTKCVQNSSVVNIGIALIYGTMNSLRCFVSSFYNRKDSKCLQYCLQLVIQQDESFPVCNKARNLLLAFQQRLYSLLYSRRMRSTSVDTNVDYATPK